MSNTYTKIERWPSEIPLLTLVILISTIVWIPLGFFLLMSGVGLLFILLYIFINIFLHVTSIAIIRGNGAHVGPDQMPEIYASLERLCQQFGLEKIPETYVIQAGGIINAFATKFLGKKILVLHAHLLDACGDNSAARDMIIAHELGHIKAGHLGWHWFLFPGMIIPFLGKALYRAREYTCDRYGLAGAGNKEGAIQGLMILSGGNQAKKMSPKALAQQVHNLNTGWMRIGEWLLTHPLVTRRICALDADLKPSGSFNAKGRVRAFCLMLIPLLIIAIALAAIAFISPKGLMNKQSTIQQQKS